MVNIGIKKSKGYSCSSRGIFDSQNSGAHYQRRLDLLVTRWIQRRRIIVRTYLYASCTFARRFLLLSGVASGRRLGDGRPGSLSSVKSLSIPSSASSVGVSGESGGSRSPEEERRLFRPLFGWLPTELLLELRLLDGLLLGAFRS